MGVLHRDLKPSHVLMNDHLELKVRGLSLSAMRDAIIPPPKITPLPELLAQEAFETRIMGD
jgi:hypothetical protein